MTNQSATIVVHPSTRRGFAAERLRNAAQIEDATERANFLDEALAKFAAWSEGIGVAPHKIQADVAILRCEFFPPPQRRQA
jgi:hypothetical protein